MPSKSIPLIHISIKTFVTAAFESNNRNTTYINWTK